MARDVVRSEPERGPDAWIEQVLDLLDEGRPEEALECLSAVSEEDPARWLLAFRAHYELGLHDRAAASLDRARDLTEADDPDVLRAQGTLCIGTWQLARARSTLERLDSETEDASLLFELALLADLDEDPERSHQLLLDAHRREPELHPAPIRLSPDDFEELVSHAAAALPAPFRATFEATPVIIDPMPSAEILGAPESGLPPDVYGLFVGRMAGEEEIPGELPPRIFLFQRNLERDAATRPELEEEIRITLYHELAHALGFEEDGVDEMGLG